MLAAKATGRCTFSFGQPVVDATVSDGSITGVVLGDGKTIQAPVVLNAAGPHSAAVNRMIFAAAGAPANDMAISTRPLRQEVAYVPAPPGCDYENFGPVMTDLDTGVYFRPEIGNRILVGGVEPDCDPLEWLDHPDDASPSLSDVHTSHILRLALRMPELQLPSASACQGIVACYDVTPDWCVACKHNCILLTKHLLATACRCRLLHALLIHICFAYRTPIYDRSSLPGYYLAIGTSGNQFKNAGVAGVMMAELIDRCEAGADQDEDPLQFNLRLSGAGSINTGRFSRLRKPDGGANVLG